MAHSALYYVSGLITLRLILLNLKVVAVALFMVPKVRQFVVNLVPLKLLSARNHYLFKKDRLKICSLRYCIRIDKAINMYVYQNWREIFKDDFT